MGKKHWVKSTQGCLWSTFRFSSTSRKHFAKETRCQMKKIKIPKKPPTGWRLALPTNSGAVELQLSDHPPPGLPIPWNTCSLSNGESPSHGYEKISKFDPLWKTRINLSLLNLRCKCLKTKTIFALNADLFHGRPSTLSLQSLNNCPCFIAKRWS